ncbi:putative catalase-peroxidase [Phytophthora cinnamomi]|uniref:putative catalase-peroxidase n=1 Tax=Phytophthora cinnamomi TaxID=4785 RepID=UPI0035596784|nr:putative catalase-peroxidase [Phytophthora cinnamomi]
MKESYPTLSTADLVELAGQVALEDAGNVTIDSWATTPPTTETHGAEGDGYSGSYCNGSPHAVERVIPGAPNETWGVSEKELQS